MRYRITQRKEDCHYETTLWDNRFFDGWYPFLSAYGTTQEQADTKLISKLTEEQMKQ